MWIGGGVVGGGARGWKRERGGEGGKEKRGGERETKRRGEAKQRWWTTRDEGRGGEREREREREKNCSGRGNRGLNSDEIIHFVSWSTDKQTDRRESCRRAEGPRVRGERQTEKT